MPVLYVAGYVEYLHREVVTGRDESGIRQRREKRSEVRAKISGFPNDQMRQNLFLMP